MDEAEVIANRVKKKIFVDLLEKLTLEASIGEEYTRGYIDGINTLLEALIEETKSENSPGDGFGKTVSNLKGIMN